MSVNCNATQSPLLSLPGELRNKIWEFAMGGNVVNVLMDPDEPRVVSNTFKKVVIVFRGNAIERPEDIWDDDVKLVSSFHLPEVCRQTYYETVSLGYALNTFTFDESFCIDVFGSMTTWAKSLIPAHRNAVIAIELDQSAFASYISYPELKLKEIFPGLKKIYARKDIHSHDLDFQFAKCSKGSGWNYEERMNWMQKKVKERDGEDVKLLFEHSSPGNNKDGQDPKGEPKEQHIKFLEMEFEESEKDFEYGSEEQSEAESGEESEDSEEDPEIEDIGID